MSQPKIQDLPTIHHLNIEVTRQCNQRCFYCFNDSGPWVSAPTHTFVDWLDVCRKLRLRGLESVHITGGEPFTWPDTMDLLSGLQRDGFRTSVLSNGFRVPALIQRHPDVFKRLTVAQISLDSMDETVHDERRGVPGAWKQATNAIEALSGFGVPVEISCTVTPENLHDLRAIAAYSRATGSRLIVRQLAPTGRGEAVCVPHSYGARLHEQLAHIQALFPGILSSDRFSYVPDQSGVSLVQPGIATVDPRGFLRSRPKMRDLFSLLAAA